MQFNVSYAPPAFIRLLRRERIAPLLQKQPHAGGCGAFRWNEVSLAGDGEVHRDGLADPNGGRDLVDVMHAILVWERPVSLGPNARNDEGSPAVPAPQLLEDSLQPQHAGMVSRTTPAAAK